MWQFMETGFPVQLFACILSNECPEDDSCLIFDSFWQQQLFGNYPQMHGGVHWLSVMTIHIPTPSSESNDDMGGP